MAAVVFTSILLALGAYVLGSIPTGVLVARRRGIDLRHVGSGNVGATNVGRALGKGWAIFVLVGDAAKGAVPVLAAQCAFPSHRPWTVAAVALAAILGHMFSAFLRGRGGKGVATSLGAAAAIAPLPALACLGLYLLVFVTLRLSSVGSLAGVVAFPVLLFLFGDRQSASLTFAVVMALLVIFRHRDNIRRLIKGTELRA